MRRAFFTSLFRCASLAPVALLPSLIAGCDETPQAEYPANAAPSGDVDDDDANAAADPDGYSDGDPSALTDFRPTLDPHGTWVEDPDYGTVWIPRSDVVGADFTPYVTAGHWVYGDDWVWVSDYEWGWAPFHYGRWVWIEGRGWAWIPGRVYRGAWVVWAVGEPGYAYVGWSPWPAFWIWRGGYALRLGVRVYPRYVYCAHGDVFAPVVAGHVVARGAAVGVATHMRPFAPAHGAVNASVGPAPSHLGLSASQVAHPPPGDRGLARAQSFSRAPSAQAMGGRAPSMPARRSGGGNSSSGATRAPSHSAPRGGGGFRGGGGGGRHR